MEEIKIEKNVPLPKRTTEKYIQALKQMENGDSFLITDEEITQNLRSRIQAAAFKAGCEIKQKKEGAGLRIWKVS